MTAAASAPTIDELAIVDDPERWSAIGFTIADGQCQLGDVRLRFHEDADTRGLVGWSLRDLRDAELDGLATTVSERPPPPAAPEHPNGVVAIDHVVAMSPALDRSVGALERAGFDLRRIREQPTPAGAPRQAFFRLGATLLELIQEPYELVERAGGPDRPARFWGLALRVSDLERTAASIGPHMGTIRPAVQAGRQIATLRRSAGLAAPLAFMSDPVA